MYGGDVIFNITVLLQYLIELTSRYEWDDTIWTQWTVFQAVFFTSLISPTQLRTEYEYDWNIESRNTFKAICMFCSIGILLIYPSNAAQWLLNEISRTTTTMTIDEYEEKPASNAIETGEALLPPYIVSIASYGTGYYRAHYCCWNECIIME